MDSALLGLTSAACGLAGVLVGGWLTSRNQKRERQVRFFREQLGELYGPMLAIRAEMLAKAELKLKISGAAGAAWQETVGNARREGGVQRIREVREASFPMFKEILKYNDRQFAEEIMPSYRKMVQLFVEKMHFAEVSTIEYLENLIDFVEIWNRWLAGSLPSEVVERLGHSEEKLFPFYRDVASHFMALQAEMKESRGWWNRRKRPERIKVVSPR